MFLELRTSLTKNNFKINLDRFLYSARVFDMNKNNKILLGFLKDDNRPVYLYDFEWQCGWYWAGGYIGNAQFHALFDGCFLDVPDYRGNVLGFKPSDMQNGCAVWENLGTFLNNPCFTPSQWWRIKDLFKQFYALKNAAEVFQYGGYCTSNGRNPAEINKEMAAQINKHIETVIIPEIRKITGLDKNKC